MDGVPTSIWMFGMGRPSPCNQHCQHHAKDHRTNGPWSKGSERLGASLVPPVLDPRCQYLDHDQAQMSFFKEFGWSRKDILMFGIARVGLGHVHLHPCSCRSTYWLLISTHTMLLKCAVPNLTVHNILRSI